MSTWSVTDPPPAHSPEGKTDKRGRYNTTQRGEGSKNSPSRCLGASLKPQCHFPTCQMHSCHTAEGRAAITATNLKLVHSFHHCGQNESLNLIYVNIKIIKTAHIFLPNNFSCGIHLEEIKGSCRNVCIKLGFFSS